MKTTNKNFTKQKTLIRIEQVFRSRQRQRPARSGPTPPARPPVRATTNHASVQSLPCACEIREIFHHAATETLLLLGKVRVIVVETLGDERLAPRVVEVVAVVT